MSKRKLHGEAELLAMDINDDIAFSNSADGIELKAGIKKLTEALSIGSARRKARWYDKFDELLRLSAACFMLMTCSVFFSIPVTYYDHIIL